MSQSTWKKRETSTLTCPSGTVCQVRRLGPELAIHSGKIQRLMKRAQDNHQGDADFFEGMSEQEAAAFWKFATNVVIATVVSPRIVLNPGPDELGADDVPLEDFWHIYKHSMGLLKEAPVQLTEGESTVESVETFPNGQTADAFSGNDGEQIQGAPC